MRVEFRSKDVSLSCLLVIYGAWSHTKASQHVGFVCVDRSGMMDPGEDGASSLTRAKHMKSHKLTFERWHRIL